MKSTWWAYLENVAPTATLAALAKLTGVDAAAITRWKRDGNPSASAVVSVARALGRPPVEALAAAGIIDWEETSVPIVERHSSLNDYSIDDLFEALAARLRDIESSNRPLSEYSLIELAAELQEREIGQ